MSRMPRCASLPRGGGVPVPAALWLPPGVRLAGGREPFSREGLRSEQTGRPGRLYFTGWWRGVSCSFPGTLTLSPELSAPSSVLSHPAVLFLPFTPHETNARVFQELIWGPAPLIPGRGEGRGTGWVRG